MAFLLNVYNFIYLTIGKNFFNNKKKLKKN